MDTVPVPPQRPPVTSSVRVTPVVQQQGGVLPIPPQQPLKSTAVRPLVVLGSLFAGILAIGAFSYVVYYHNLNNSIVVRSQQIGKSVQFDKVVVGYNKGGYVVIQRSSSFASGKRIANSGLIPPGTYVSAGIDLAKPDSNNADDVPIEQGEYLYAVLYGEMDDVEGLTPGDGQLKNLLGQYSVARFQAQ